MDSDEVEILRGSLRSIPFGDWPEAATVESRTARVRAQLQVTGRDLRYLSVPDLGLVEGSNRTIDVGWYRDGELKVAFRVDGAVTQRSVELLGELPGEVEKVIISKSPNPTYINEQAEANLPDDFHHIDVGFYEHR